MKTLNQETINLIKKELESIPEKYQKNFNSTHEGLSVLWEEFEELKQEVFFGEKGIEPHVFKEKLQKEAVQVAAMAVRFIQELTKDEY